MSQLIKNERTWDKGQEIGGKTQGRRDGGHGTSIEGSRTLGKGIKRILGTRGKGKGDKGQWETDTGNGQGSEEKIK